MMPMNYYFLKNYSNIKKFLSLSIFKNCSSILINWKYYGDNNELFYKPKLLQKRFTKPFYFTKNSKNIYFYSAAKSIIRGGLNITWAHCPHYLDNQVICKSDGSVIKTYFSDPQFSIAYLKHYATKSTQEFIEKLIRGQVLSSSNFL